ncbi:MauE/DoxX family redox-associated membrane protein [Microbacterium rhizosphaerae]|uniref:MauE/DoxX family redox-associated membrane protein n=1 Tax=Microbacterium rhizosphaerae TaxID=1678237 RepID=A0ABZ0SR05_9MICO|nr:MauE/DoxX family redox-associated membrane protein [Microbacterium rhizosphaerae]WPR89746.1 MauE/DoxX family redox-associated membrane protein [Microbacterium rhizosphaerae]
MPGALTLALPLMLAAVLITSGIAKLRHPDDLSGWRELGVPRALQREWLLRVHPWGEIALGLALLVLGGLLGLLAALVAVFLMAWYVRLVAIAWRADDGAECACFGVRKRVTGVTVVRNIWLTAVAIAAAAVVWTLPLLGGAVAGITAAGAWWWVVALLVASVTAVIIMWPGGEQVSAAAAEPRSTVDGDDQDYVRVRTPSVPVTLADGRTVNLRSLTRARPVLLLAVSTVCGSCNEVIAKIGEWRALLPEVDVRFLLPFPPEISDLIEREEPQSLHDSDNYVRDSIADWATPTAVLLGVDNMLAGGPISGTEAIKDFVQEIRASLDEMTVA